VKWGLVVVSGMLHVLYYIALLRGYRKADLTDVYPLARASGHCSPRWWRYGCSASASSHSASRASSRWWLECFSSPAGRECSVPRTIRQSGPAFARGCCTAC